MKNLISSLQHIFGDCKRPNSSNCLVKSSYETITQRQFFIFDDSKNQEPVRIVGKRNSYQLVVNNRHKENNEICLIKTDKCLFTDKFKKCDCILFNHNKIFFVEISEASMSGRNKKRNEAVIQLSTTIQLFNDNNIDLSFYEAYALICIKRTEPRIPQSSLNSKKEVFREKYQIDLVEGEEISF
jgi:hypothetical protein